LRKKQTYRELGEELRAALHTYIRTVLGISERYGGWKVEKEPYRE